MQLKKRITGRGRPSPRRPLGCVLFILLLGVVSIPAHAEGMTLFGTRESMSSDLTHFPKWTGMLARDGAQRKTASRCKNKDCLPPRWSKVLREAKGKPVKEMLRIVNRGFNASTYTVDQVNWGREDYWETPLEFLQRRGDCEDYAIIKYMALKELGVAPDTMRIVVLEDRNLRLLHSVLVVRHAGVNYILDNQVEPVLTDLQIHHYTPIYSINEQSWWRHLPR